MEPTIDSILDRIRKLLSLSTSDNINEAATAASKAQELIEKYKLDVAAINADNGTDNFDPILEDEVSLSSGQRVITWQSKLISSLCRVNTCRAWYSNRIDNLSHRVLIDLKLVGSRTNVEIVRYLFSYLVVEIERLAQHEMKFGNGKGQGKTYGNNFRIGAVQAINDRIKNINKTVHEQYSGSKALAIIEKQEYAINDYWKEFEKRKGLSPGTSFSIKGNADAREAGYKAGSLISLGTKGLSSGGKLLKQ